ncbi:hypothetical protein AAVH_28602 [Aphelenchoides avenae]|nr:hypothetical protein AAVH_28602 [Aphelenchus avenae]
MSSPPEASAYSPLEEQEDDDTQVPTGSADNQRPVFHVHTHEAFKVIVITGIIVGYVAFFQLAFNKTSFDVAFHQDWIHNTTFFGEMIRSHPTLMKFVGWRHISTAISSGIIAVLGLSPTVQRNSLGFFMVGCGLTAFSGVFLLISLLAVYVPSIFGFCSVCFCFIFSRVLFGAGNGMTWCFGVSYLYGVTRDVVHSHQLELMGAMAFAMLFGEAIGILVAYFGELFCDWSWATTTAVITPRFPPFTTGYA